MTFVASGKFNESQFEMYVIFLQLIHKDHFLFEF